MTAEIRRGGGGIVARGRRKNDRSCARIKNAAASITLPQPLASALTSSSVIQRHGSKEWHV